LPGEPWILSAWFLPGKHTKNLFLARPDGTDSHVILADLPGEHVGAAWSPDGSRFAFANTDVATPKGSIWTANADGTMPALLTNGSSDCPDGMAHPSWSPDSSKLSVICYPDPGGKEGSVATFDLATGQITRLYTVHWPEHLDGSADWSPDGASLAFTIYHYDPTDQFIDGSLVATLPALGGTVRRLTTFADDMTEGSWSPDGSEIAIAKNDVGMRHASDQASNVYAIHADGTGLRQITKSSVDGYMRIFAPEWIPDGRMLVEIGIAPHQANGDITVNDLMLAFVNPAGGEPALLPPTIHGGILRPTPAN
jgi:Tol biopolymer transport system component